MVKSVHIQYYAVLREVRGTNEETIETDSKTLQDLYSQLTAQYGFPLGMSQLRVAVNENLVPWETVLNNGDAVVFIPPVAGG